MFVSQVVRGQYGHVWLRIEPQAAGEGFEFVNAIVGGVIPREYIPAVEKGIKEQMENGVIAGYPVVDVKVTLSMMVLTMTLTLVKWHLKLLVLCGFKEGARKAKPVVLEPIMKVEVVTPEEYMGDVIGDLNRRRGVIQGMDEGPAGKIVSAEVPLAEMFGYATDFTFCIARKSYVYNGVL